MQTIKECFLYKAKKPVQNIENAMIRIKLNPRREMPVIGIKIMDKKYAEGFVKEGVVHFSSPGVWKDDAQASGRQLDVDEGLFCLSTEDNRPALKMDGRAFIETKDGGLYKYYSDSSEVLACCFYGVNKTSFEKKPVKYGVETIDSFRSTVGCSYFDTFNEKIGHEKAVVIIFDFPSFIKRLRNTLVTMGFKPEDIICHPVYYVCKSTPFYCKEPFPFEYFLKDQAYREQLEFRVLLRSRDKFLFERFKEGKCNIAIGDISKIASIQDYYKDGLSFSIQGNKLIYQLATPETIDLDDLPIESLVSLLLQTQGNRLPQGIMSKEEIEKGMNVLEEAIFKKTGITYDRESRTFLNVNEDIRKKLDSLFAKK